jgi:hypothetical protein
MTGPIIYTLISAAAPYLALLYEVYCRMSQRTARHAGRWRPLPHRAGSLHPGEDLAEPTSQEVARAA